MKTSESTKFTIRPGKSVVGVDDNNRAGYERSKLDGSELDGGEIDGGKVDDKIEKKGQKTSKFKKLSKSQKTLGSDFLIPRARLAFTKLR